MLWKYVLVLAVKLRSDGHSAGTQLTLASSQKLGMFAAKVCSALMLKTKPDIGAGTFAVSVLGVFALAFAIEGVRRLVRLASISSPVLTARSTETLIAASSHNVSPTQLHQMTYLS